MGRLLFIAAPALLLSACASVPTAAPELVASARSFTPSPGKGRIYVYRHGGAGLRQTVMIDGRVVGRLAHATFLMTELDPGTHTVRALGLNEDALQVVVDAGRCTYVELWTNSGMLGKAVVGLDQIGEEAARRFVAAYRMTIGQ